MQNDIASNRSRGLNFTGMPSIDLAAKVGSGEAAN
jgi:hypothetical protein